MNTATETQAVAAAPSNVTPIGTEPTRYTTDVRRPGLYNSLGVRVGGSASTLTLKEGVTPPALPDVGFFTKHITPMLDKVYDVVVETGIGSVVNVVATGCEFVDDNVVSPVIRGTKSVASSVGSGVSKALNYTTPAVDLVEDKLVNPVGTVKVLTKEEQDKRAKEAQENGVTAQPEAAAAAPLVTPAEDVVNTTVAAEIISKLDTIAPEVPVAGEMPSVAETIAVLTGVQPEVTIAPNADAAAVNSMEASVEALKVQLRQEIQAHPASQLTEEQLDRVARSFMSNMVAETARIIASGGNVNDIMDASARDMMEKAFAEVGATMPPEKGEVSEVVVETKIVDTAAGAGLSITVTETTASTPVGAAIVAAAAEPVEAPQVQVTMADEMNQRHRAVFDQKFNSIRQVVPFKPGWMGAEGSLDSMLSDETLRSYVGVGKQARTLDIQGRKVIVTGTPMGPVLVYQATLDTLALNYLAPVEVRKSGLIRSAGPELDPKEIEIILGSVDGKVSNIGKALAKLAKAST